MVVVAGLSGESYNVDAEPFYAAGSRSVQYLCRDPRGQQRLYKLYRTPVGSPEAIEWARQAMVLGRDSVLTAEAGGSTGAGAAEAIGWPLDLILHEGLLIGAILPLIPLDFLQPDGRPRTFDLLWGAAPQAAYFRVGLMIRLCDIVRVLDERGLVHGDLSPKNVLWHGTAPLAYVINTAGIAAAEAVPDRFKDRYDLASLLWRGLFPGAGPQPGSVIPAELDARVSALFDRAFNPVFTADARPSPYEWAEALRAAFLTPDGATYLPEALAVLDRHAAGFAAAPTVAITPTGGMPPTSGIPQQSLPPTVGMTVGSQTGWSNPQQPLVYQTAPQGNSNTALKVVLASLVAVLLIAVVVGVVVLGRNSGNDHSTASGTSTTTTSAPGKSTTPPAPSTPTFDKGTLNQSGTDKTPFTADALLPQTFTDSKNVAYTLRSSGSKPCVSSNMSQNVKDALNSNSCQNMMTGVYIDQSDKILLSIEVLAFPSQNQATTVYNGLKGQNQTWDIWCPTNGTGSSVCQAPTKTMFAATYSSWGQQEYRYLYESYALYINLTQDTSVTDWLEAPAKGILDVVGPDNYWHTR